MSVSRMLVLFCIGAFTVGCTDRDGAVDDAVHESIVRCVMLVEDCRRPASTKIRYELFRTAFDRIAALSAKADKIKAARELSSFVKKIDLDLLGTDYFGFSDKVSRFKSLVDWSVLSLFEAKADGEEILGCLEEGFAKYRKACFSIPITARAADERPDEYARKCQTAIALAAEYEYALIALDKAEKGHLRCLSDDLHARYRIWKRSIKSSPTAKEVQATLHTLGK